MSYSTCMYAYYTDKKGKAVPLHGDSMVSHFDPYIPGDPSDTPDERFCKLDELKPEDLPDFVRGEYGEDGGGHMFAELSLKEFRESHADAIDSYMKSMLATLDALGMDVDEDSGCFDLGVSSGKYDSDGRKNEDYSQLTWPVDKKLVLRTTNRWDDMAIGLEALGIYRVLKDMAPYGISDGDITLVLARG